MNRDQVLFHAKKAHFDFGTQKSVGLSELSHLAKQPNINNRIKINNFVDVSQPRQIKTPLKLPPIGKLKQNYFGFKEQKPLSNKTKNQENENIGFSNLSRLSQNSNSIEFLRPEERKLLQTFGNYHSINDVKSISKLNKSESPIQDSKYSTPDPNKYHYFFNEAQRKANNQSIFRDFHRNTNDFTHLPSLDEAKRESVNAYYWYFKETPSPIINDVGSNFVKMKSQRKKLKDLTVNKDFYESSSLRFNNDSILNKSNEDKVKTEGGSANSKKLSISKIKNNKSTLSINSTPESDFSSTLSFKKFGATKSAKKNKHSNRKLVLSTAQLRTMSISEKFMEDAKNMVYVPQTNSFYPKAVYNSFKR
jgi:hypothetical protein